MRGRNSITWITSLSLDAPIVVAVWQNAISVYYSTTLNMHHRVLVFLAVWLGYTADRWIDAWRNEINLSQRHSFHELRRWSLLALWALILMLSFSFSLEALSPNELRNGLTLTLASIVVTGIIQLVKLGKYRTVIKSALTALLVASSVLIFSTPESIRSMTETFSIMASLFFLNCVLIHSWDRSVDTKQNPDYSHQATRFTIIAAVVLSLGVAFSLVNVNPLSWYAISATLILVSIHICFHSLHIETRRTLADLALLTPVVAFL